MVLQKTVIEIPFGGLETKVDPKLVQPGKTLVLENAEFDELGAISKRNGYTALAKTTMSGGTISAAKAICKTSNDGLALMDGESLYTWSPTVEKWALAGTLKTLSATASGLPYLPNTEVVTGRPLTAQTAIVNGLLVYGVRSSDGGGFVGVIDVESGLALVPPYNPSNIAWATDAVRIAVSGDVVAVVGFGGTINAYTYDTSTPAATFTKIESLQDDFGHTPDSPVSYGDVAALDDDGTFVIACATNVPGILVGTFTAPFTTVASTTIAEDPDDLQIGLTVSAAGDIYVFHNNGATNRPRVTGLTSALGSLFATKDLSTTAGSDQFAAFEESANSIRVFYSHTASNQRRIVTQTVSNAGALSAVATCMRGACVASKPFAHSGTTYVAAAYTSGNSTSIQSGYFLVTTGGHVAARWLGSAGPVEADFLNSTLPVPAYIATESSGIYVLGAPMRTASTLIADDNYLVPAQVRLNFNARPTTADAGVGICIATGGLLYEFDGAAVFENGFFVYPEPVTAAQAATGTMADGNYQVVVVYAYFGVNGQLHLSAPSVAVSQTIAAGGGNASITVTIPTLRMTNRSGVFALVYCTAAGGSTFYENGSEENDTTADTITYTVTAVSTATRILYTDGGILENSAPPALSNIIRKGGRLYAMAERGVLYYTKHQIEGEPPCFVSETLVKDLYEDGGPGYALTSIDGRLAVLGEHSVQVLGGEGLNDTGTQDTLSEPQQVTTDTGAVIGTPIAVAAPGAFFKSTKGICLLDRSMATQFAGAPVEDYASLSTVSAALVPTRNQIRFGHSDGVCAVYDYNAGQWSVFTAHTQAGAAVVDGTYYFATSAGQVYEQSTGFLDNVTAIGLVVETPWLRLSGLQGYQRLYYVSLLGEWRSNHTLTLKVYYDYDPDVVETKTFTATTAALGYGAGDPLQMRHHLGRKCQAVKFRIEDSAQAGTSESLKLTGLALEIGGKGGVFRQGGSKTI